MPDENAPAPDIERDIPKVPDPESIGDPVWSSTVATTVPVVAEFASMYFGAVSDIDVAT